MAKRAIKKYSYKVGHRGDMHFATQNDKIAKIFTGDKKAECIKYIDEENARDIFDVT